MNVQFVAVFVISVVSEITYSVDAHHHQGKVTLATLTIYPAHSVSLCQCNMPDSVASVCLYVPGNLCVWSFLI